MIRANLNILFVRHVQKRLATPVHPLTMSLRFPHTGWAGHDVTASIHLEKIDHRSVRKWVYEWKQFLCIFRMLLVCIQTTSPK